MNKGFVSSMDSVEETQTQVLDYLQKVCGSMPSLSDSLAVIGIDSVAMAELTFEFEKQFGIRIDDEILDVQTVGELADYVRARVRK